MKTLDRQKLDVVNKTRSNPALRDWRGQFTPEFVEFPRNSIAGGYAEKRCTSPMRSKCGSVV